MISNGRPNLRAALSAPESKHQYVRRLFATIADRYDLITVLLSFGRDRRWKQRLVQLSGASRDSVALDVACGTGDIAFELATSGARVVGMDITPRMLQLAARKPEAPSSSVAFVAGDMMRLPFAASRFDVVTTGYGIRNVPLIEPALREILRVLKPGGVFLSLDFNRPANRLVRAIYLAYLTVVGSVLGWVLHRDADTYRYIPETIRRYPGAPAVTAMLEREGFRRAEWRPVLGGLMAFHIAWKADAFTPLHADPTTAELTNLSSGGRVRRMDVDTSSWSGEGDFTRRLIDAMKELPITRVKVEDAPSSRADAGFSFISNELFVVFEKRQPTLASLEAALTAVTDIGQPDYSDDGMLQYLRTDRIIPPYQTRGYKLVELVRIYQAGGRNGVA